MFSVDIGIIINLVAAYLVQYIYYFINITTTGKRLLTQELG